METKDTFAPFTFRTGHTARNRVALAPMTNLQSHKDGSASDDEVRWLLARADGGFGVIATCAAHIALDGQSWEGELGIYDDKLLPGLTRMASELNSRGVISLVQIFHGGARADANLTGERAWSASEIPGDPSNPRAATEGDIERVICQFRDGAARAHRAGFHGIELHGAHGYLLSQFLSSTMNTREDRWGGSLENRARLIREVTRAVRRDLPASFIVGVRLSPEDFGQAKGIDLDETLTVARWLADDGTDFVHASLWDVSLNTKKRPDEHPIPLFRRALPEDVALFVAGKIWTLEDAQTALDRGADFVALGRSGITNPDWPLRAREPGFTPKRPPLTAQELRDRGLSDTFVRYMRRWKGFVTDDV